MMFNDLTSSLFKAYWPLVVVLKGTFLQDLSVNMLANRLIISIIKSLIGASLFEMTINIYCSIEEKLHKLFLSKNNIFILN